MTTKEQLYEAYVSSGQAGVDSRAPLASVQKKLTGRRPYIESLIRRFFPKDRQARIVDIGCGHGTLLQRAKEQGYRNIAGVDRSREQVELAHQLGVSEVELGDAMPFLLRQPPADVVCCLDVLEHLTLAESSEILNHVFKLLKPAGMLLVHVPNGEGLFGQRIRYGDLTHETCFTPRSIRQLLTVCGFRSVHCFEDKPIPHGWRSLLRRIIWDIGTLWPRLLLAAETGDRRFVLSQNMLVVASK